MTRLPDTLDLGTLDQVSGGCRTSAPAPSASALPRPTPRIDFEAIVSLLGEAGLLPMTPRPAIAAPGNWDGAAPSAPDQFTSLDLDADAQPNGIISGGCVHGVPAADATAEVDLTATAEPATIEAVPTQPRPDSSLTIISGGQLVEPTPMATATDVESSNGTTVRDHRGAATATAAPADHR